MVSNGDRTRAERGLQEALDRFDRHIGSLATGDPLIPLAEALNWAYALEEWHESKLREVGVRDYYSRRDYDPDGQIVAGLMYARGLVVHQLANVSILVSVYRDTYYDAYGAYTQWRWRPFAQLPKPGKLEKRDRDKKYEKYVQNQPILDTINTVERFFTRTVPTYYL